MHVHYIRCVCCSLAKELAVATVVHYARVVSDVTCYSMEHTTKNA